MKITSIDTSSLLTKDDTKQLQQIHGKCVYYALVVDDTMIHPINIVVTKVIIVTEEKNNHFMNYSASNPNAIKLYRTYGVILMTNGNFAYFVKRET